MLNKMTTTINRLCPKTRPYKILTCPTHEGFQTMLSYTGQEFYMLTGPNIKGWDFHTRPLPPNHYLYTLPAEQMNALEQWDIILCQNKVQQYGVLQPIAKQLNIPMIILDHTEPPPGVTPKQMVKMQTLRGDAHVFITNHNKQSWGGLEGDRVIYHGIDTEIFQGYTGEIQAGVSMVNHFRQRDIFCGWTLWEAISAKTPMKLIGENPGISESINDIKELVATLAKHRFYLNTSQHSPVPLSMMEAMAIGLPVVTTPKQECVNVIQHGVNGFIGETEEELMKYCHQLINNPELAKEMGAAARQTVIDKFNIDRFASEWNTLFKEII